MNSVQESKNELNAAIRYAENAISSAKQTIESMEFRQEMAKKQYSEQTGREAVLESELAGVRQLLDKMTLEHTDREEALQREVADLKERLKMEIAAVERLRKDPPTMPVIPKAVAIAIFREGVQHGVEAACTELEGQYIRIEESEYVGDFHVTFERRIDLDDELDLDWMREKCGDYSEESAIDALGTLCADEKFECRIHGIDDQEENKND